MGASYSILCFYHRLVLLPLLMLNLHLYCVLSDDYPAPAHGNCTTAIPIRLPFNYLDDPRNCGINVMSCSEGVTWISLFNEKLRVSNISYTDRRIDILFGSMFFKEHLCRSPEKFNPQEDKLFLSDFRFQIPHVTTVFKCSDGSRHPGDMKKLLCEDGSELYISSSPDDVHQPDFECNRYEFPAPAISNETLTGPPETFSLHWERDCDSGGNNLPVCHCKDGSAKPSDCKGATTPENCDKLDDGDQTNHKIILAVILGVVLFYVVLVTCFILFLCFRNRKCKRQSHVVASSYIGSSSSRTSNQPNLESTSFYRRCRNVTIFSYEELEKATNGFSPSNELGDGGFGIVYYGVLGDGKKVAVKRLFEHSFNRVEQFMNEIEILSNIQHTNLVQLYGCTTRNSRELLLVYEYVDNGTVGDHLNGSRAAKCSLTWKLRLNIAVKTAEALAYLHQLKPPIIHRDVKTSNILLNRNFHVKVSDFGLSMLFPFDVSHVSTVPQGTPGYIDPQYHQRYQLTDRSDVYSFGVVLMELISSLPAVDIMRPRDEVNLANMAINMIHNNALHEFVDSSLGFQSDYLVQKSVGAVAELAFSCLAYDMEVRPMMNEVAETLRQIQAQVQESERYKPTFQALVKSTLFLKAPGYSSPNPVDDKQVKQSTIPNSIV